PAGTAPAPAPAAPAARPVPHGLGGVGVVGAVRCAAHPAGCAGWVTVIDARGKRVAAGPFRAGRYRVDGLRPGNHTLVVSTPDHAPHAEFLRVPAAPGTGPVEHDLRL
ncbi:FUSC family protein, partial [Streptomyces sp. NPDC023723]